MGTMGGGSIFGGAAQAAPSMGAPPMPDANPMRADMGVQSADAVGGMNTGPMDDAAVGNMLAERANEDAVGNMNQSEGFQADLDNYDLPGVPENFSEMENYLRDHPEADPEQIAAMLAMGQFEFQHLPNEEGAFYKAYGGEGGKMQGALQTHTGHHGSFDNPDDYIAKQLEFFGGGRTPDSKGTFDPAGFGSMLDSLAEDGVSSKDFWDSLKANGMDVSDYHPMMESTKSWNRMSDDTAQYLYNQMRGGGKISSEQFQKLLPQINQDYKGF